MLRKQLAFGLALVTMLVLAAFAGASGPRASAAVTVEPAAAPAQLGTANLRIAHLAPFAAGGAPVTLRVNGADLLTNVTFGTISPYLNVPAGPYQVQVIPNGSPTPAISETVTLAAGDDYTAAAIGDGVASYAPVELNLLTDDNSLPASGKVRLRILHTAPFSTTLEGTRVDIRTQSGDLVAGLANVPYKGDSGFLELDAGAYDLQVTAPGGGPAIIDIPPLVLSPGDVLTVFAVGNALEVPRVLVAPGVTGEPARLRVAHLAPLDTVGSAVDVKVDGATVLSNFTFGTITPYLELPGGSHLVEIFPSGSTTSAISGTIILGSGRDYTAAALGKINGPGYAPLELVLLEDNNVPSATAARVRIYHAAPFGATLQDTEVDIRTDAGAVVAGLTNVPYKGDSGYLELPPATYDLSVTTPGGGAELIDVPTLNLAAGDIATAFAAGDNVNITATILLAPGAPRSPARVKVAHLAPFANTIAGTAVTVKVNGADLLTNFTYPSIITDYVELPFGSYDVEVVAGGTTVLSGTYELFSGKDYTVAAIGGANSQPLSLLALEDNNSAPPAGKGKLRVVHTAPFANTIAGTAVSIRTQAGDLVGGLSNVTFGQFSTYLELNAGVYDLKIATPDGSTTLIDIPPFVLSAGQVATVYAIGDGTNQTPTITSDPPLPSPARVKVAHLAPFTNTITGTTVTVKVNGADALTDFTYGEITDYINLPFGPTELAIDVPGLTTEAIVLSSTVTLESGKDYTVAAIGGANSLPLSLLALADDNTPPAAGNGKVRIVHSAPFSNTIAGTAVSIRTQDGTLIPGLNNVTFGQFSPYLQLPAGLYDLKVATPDGSTTLIDIPAFRLESGQIITVFATGDGTNQPVTIRRDPPFELFLPRIQLPAAPAR